jgi:hypothetical protein
MQAMLAAASGTAGGLHEFRVYFSTSRFMDISDYENLARMPVMLAIASGTAGRFARIPCAFSKILVSECARLREPVPNTGHAGNRRPGPQAGECANCA